MKAFTTLLRAFLPVLAFAVPMAASAAEKAASTDKPPAAGKPAKDKTAAIKSDHRAPARQMEQRWIRIQTTIRPDQLVAMCDDFVRDFPDSPHRDALTTLRGGAERSLAAIRAAQLTVEALDEPGGDADYRASLALALRGDKDAAHRVAMMYRAGSNDIPADQRRHEQWLQVAAELGRGDAAWAMAELFNRRGMVAEAARFEAIARESGFKIPPRLPTKSLNF